MSNTDERVKQLEKTVSILKKELIQADKDIEFLSKQLTHIVEFFENQTSGEDWEGVKILRERSILCRLEKKTFEEMLDEFIKIELNKS